MAGTFCVWMTVCWARLGAGSGPNRASADVSHLVTIRSAFSIRPLPSSQRGDSGRISPSGMHSTIGAADSV